MVSKLEKKFCPCKHRLYIIKSYILTPISQHAKDECQIPRGHFSISKPVAGTSRYVIYTFKKAQEVPRVTSKRFSLVS